MDKMLTQNGSTEVVTETFPGMIPRGNVEAHQGMNRGEYGNSYENGRNFVDGVVKNTRIEMGRMGAAALQGRENLRSSGERWSLAEEGLARDEREMLHDERELSRDEREMLRPGEFVGEETALQTRERLAADEEDLRNEANLAPTGATKAERDLLLRDHKIVQQAQDAVTTVAATEVDRIMAQPVFRPAELVKVREEGMLKMLRNAFGYEFGNGN